MAEVTVFIDDAVRGTLPDVCVKDGVSTSSRLRVVQEIGQSTRLGILWLLVFLGPLGWIALFVLGGRDRGEQLTVQVPFGDAAYERLVAARRVRWQAIAAGVIGGTGLAALSGWAHLGPAGVILTIGVIVVAIVAALMADRRVFRGSVHVTLDASRRWVTLDSVHPAFVTACQQRTAHPQRS